MAYDVVKFVDSIAASPTTRLDVNDGSQWMVRDFSAPPPRIRRSAVSNAMTDGAYVSSSTYDVRVLTLEIDLITTTQDNGATELQKLARELDRPTNFLMYQPNTLTKPVFFKTWRSDFSDVVEVKVVSGTFKQLTVEVLAEPFAIGLRETVSVGTVNNDPAAGSNGCYFDVTGVKGDVAVPMVLVDTGTLTSDVMFAVRQHGTVTDLPVAIQAESMTLGTDTSNPGGGPDAAMSGSGTNNYVRCTYASGAGMNAERVTYTTTTTATLNALRGLFRAVAVVRRTSAADNIYVALEVDGSYGAHVANSPVLLPATTSRIQIDLGLVAFGSSDSPASPYMKVYYTSLCTGTTADLDWDYVMFLPADETTGILTVAATTDDLVIDGEIERAYLVANGANLYSSGTRETYAPALITGGFPRLVPNQTNRVFYIKHTAGVISKSTTGTVTLYYQPAYLHVRPATT